MRAFSAGNMLPRLSVVALALALCAPASVQDPTSGWPETPASVRFGATLDGARIHVGVLLPQPEDRRVFDLIPKEKLEAFLANEPSDKADAISPEPEFGIPPAFDADAAAAHLAKLGAEVEVVERLADECHRLPIVLVADRTLSAPERTALARYATKHGILFLDAAPRERIETLLPSAIIDEHPLGAAIAELARGDAELTRVLRKVAAADLPPCRIARLDGRIVAIASLRPVLCGGEGNGRFLAGAIALAALRAPAVREYPGPGLAIHDARRAGGDVIVRLRAPATEQQSELEARVLSLSGETVWKRVQPVSGPTTLRFPFDDAARDPCTHWLQLDWRHGRFHVRTARTIEQLVGTLQRRIVGSNVVHAGGTYALRIVFAHSRTQVPAAGVPETIALVRGERVFASADGVSNAEGTMDLRLAVPDDMDAGPATLRIGSSTLDVTVRRDLRLSVTTDRPLYREHDRVQVRAMLHRFPSARVAPGELVTFALRDPRERVIARHSTTTSAHGIATADFELTGVDAGTYSVTLEAGSARATRELRVAAFELPRFTLACEPSALALEAHTTQEITLTARYVDGAPLAGAGVTVVADAQATPYAPGKTDRDGVYRLSYHAGETPDRIELSVRDADGRVERTVVPVAITRSGLRVELRRLEPLVPGREGRVEIHATRWADGKPVDGRGTIEISTLPAIPFALAGGRAVVKLTPDRARPLARVRATSTGGETGQLSVRLKVTKRAREHPLVLVESLVAEQSDTLVAQVLATDGPVFVDVLREDVPLRTLSGRVAQGSARFAIPLDADLTGELVLHAYRLEGLATKGTRQTVFVKPRRCLDVTAQTVEPSHRPGETAAVDVRVRRNGEPTAAALGYWAVDSALLQLARSEPGDETVFTSLPSRTRDGLVELALEPAAGAAAPAPFETAARVLGGPEPIADQHSLSHDSLVERRAAALAAAQGLTETRIAALRAAFVAALSATPLAELRVSGSVRQTLRWLVARGSLPPALLRDPWGEPLELTQLWNDVQVAARCPFAAGTLAVTWDGEELLDALPARLRALVTLLQDSAFDSEAFHTVIGIGGGTGGRFSLRGHSRGGLGRGGRALAGEPAPVRRDFRPTLCFVPELLVGPSGNARLLVPLADSITTWKMRLVASDLDGHIGVASTDIRVTQPFSIEPWLARTLTAGDAVELPVAVRYAGAGATDARLELGATGAVSVASDASATVRVAGGITGAHRFTLRAATPGRAQVRVGGDAGEHKDAVERRIEVRPLGRAVRELRQAAVSADAPWKTTWNVAPSDVAPASLTLRAYPTPLASVQHGFEALVREPHGCFEQTLSTLYPMVLALQYLKRTGQSSPELEAKARTHITSGYRRALSYEVAGSGGFELFGRSPARTMVTAYGLLAFTDIGAVHPIDPELVPRIRKFLETQQRSDGSFYEPGCSRFATTAYVAWAIARSGAPNHRACRWLEAQRDADLDADLDVDLARAGAGANYARALAVLALLESRADPERRAALAGSLARAANTDGAGHAFWEPGAPTLFGGRRASAAVETTALAALGLLRNGGKRALVQRALDWLTAGRRAAGHFGTTQSTVLALTLLLEAAGTNGDDACTVRVLAGGEERARRDVAAGSAAPVVIELGEVRPGRHEIEVVVDTRDPGARETRRLQVEQVLETWEPWRGPIHQGPLRLEVVWPEKVAVHRGARARVTLHNDGSRAARSVTAEIGLPPGCRADARDVRAPELARVERREQSLVVYLDNIALRGRVSFEIPFEPLHAFDARTMPSRAYEYYTPEEACVIPPARVVAVRGE